MIKADDFLSLCKVNRFNFFSGTPCSYLKPLINAVIDDSDIDYLPAANEGDAVAAVCGAYLIKRNGVVMFQNSGFGNAVNPLTSLSFPFRFPFIMIVTHRGQPGGPPDEPQHELMGQITEEMLTTLRIKWEHFPDNVTDLKAAFARAQKHMETAQQPFAFVLRKGTIEAQELKFKKSETPIGERKLDFSENLQKKYSDRPTRTDALKLILKHQNSNDIIVATTGKTGRELYTIQDTPDQLYMVGSMGCASSFSLGAALCSPDYRWVTIDGDAAALMHMGNFASVGSALPENYLHIILDNEVNDSTGGQDSISSNVSMAAVAKACGYLRVYSSDDLAELESILAREKTQKGPVVIHFRTKKGSPKDLGRPKIKPFEVKERLMKYLKA